MFEFLNFVNFGENDDSIIILVLDKVLGINYYILVCLDDSIPVQTVICWFIIGVVVMLLLLMKIIKYIHNHLFDIRRSFINLQFIRIENLFEFAEMCTILEFYELFLGSELCYLDHGFIVSVVDSQKLLKRVIMELDFHRVQIVEAHSDRIELINFLPYLLVILLLFHILDKELILLVLKNVDLKWDQQNQENGIRIVPGGW